MRGFTSSKPVNDAFSFQASLGPDEALALLNFGKIIGALNHYFTKPMADNPNDWVQCMKCLQVTNITALDQEQVKALWLMCNQHVPIRLMTPALRH